MQQIHSASFLCCRVMRDRFYQFSWRPRPPSLLSEAQLKEIARNLRKYSEKYAKEDDVLMAQVRLLQRRLSVAPLPDALPVCVAPPAISTGSSPAVFVGSLQTKSNAALC
jgi:hypothetical protein